MPQYQYETHLHTSEVSACSACSGAEQARIYKDLGYTGIIVTDHFFNGNTCVPSNLPWNERVNRFMLGYEHAKEEGERIGLSVFFGFEESFQGTDYLVYGLGKEWLLDNPDILEWDIPKTYARIHKAGGYIVHAHPFREAEYIPGLRLYPEFEDAVEVYNTRHKNPEFNLKALAYAKQNNKPITGGSDAHQPDDKRGGMVFDHELKDIRDYIDCVRNGRVEMIIEL